MDALTLGVTPEKLVTKAGGEAEVGSQQSLEGGSEVD
jgi:hypothetical protein